jgi:colanic acid/amylovoran biosynthesis glycosyltransferase
MQRSKTKPTLTKIAYLTLWFPKASETFIFTEVLNLWEMGLPLKVFTLYGDLKRQLSPEMLSIPVGKVEHLGMKSITRLPGDIRFWFKRNKILSMRLFKTVPLRRWKSIEFGGENIIGFLYGFTLARRFLEEPFDHIHAAWAMGPATAAWVASELTGIPFSFTGRAGDIYPPDGALEEKIKAAKFIISDNMTNVPYLENLVPGSKTKIFGIYNGIPLRKVVDAPVPMVPPYRLLGLGRFDRIKAFHVLLHACKILKDEGLSFKLTLAGDGPRKIHLKLLRRRLGLVDQVFFPGFVPYNRVSNLFCSSDLFVMSSAVHRSGDRDGLPTVIMEALTHRLPVVSTDVCGIPEVIQNGVTGLLVKQNDPQSLANGIKKMLEDREKALNMAQKGQELVLREFNQKKNHQKIFDLLVNQVYGAQN